MTYSTSPQVQEVLRPIGETARQLGVSIDTIRRWHRDGKIRAVRTVGQQRRFPQSEIDRLLGLDAA